MTLKVLTKFALLAASTFALVWIQQNLIPACSAQNVRRTDRQCKSLQECAEVGDTKTLNELLRQTTQIDARDEYGETLLFTAVRYDNNAATALLISRGANVNALNNNGTSPLMMAVLSQNLSLISDLINAGADVNASDQDGDTVLIHGAVFAGEQTCGILRLLVSHGANVNAAANDGRTALIYSISSLSVETVKCLLSLGANANARDRKELAALDHVDDIASYNASARKIKRRMRKLLIAAGVAH